MFASALLLGACEFPEVFSNGDIDSWCGDKPCGWEVDGKVRRVSTWHSHDYAASLESDGARLHQLSEAGSYPCLSFSMIAKVGKGAKASLELDFLDDGGDPDWTGEIPESNFEHFEFAVTAPEWYSNVRVSVRKVGDGEVVIAQLRATYEGVTECEGEPLPLPHLPGGAPCDDNGDCATEMCRSGYCVGCESDDDCEDGQTCGYSEIQPLLDFDREVYFALDALPMCVGPNVRNMGQLCLSDAECKTSVCCEGVCSTCCGETGCEEGSACERSTVGDGEATAILEPHLCSAGLRMGEPGAYCTSDDDCESSSCAERACTGLCTPLGSISADCARLKCDEAECSSVECAVETVEVGRCQ